MHNLKELNGTFKGLIGECLFKSTRKYVVVPKYFNKSKYALNFGKYLNCVQLNFILCNWYSIDALEILYEKGVKKIVLYEVKTKNEEWTQLRFKTKITQSTVDIYNKAKQLGFNVKIAYVLFCDNWNFEIKIEEFDENNFCIDKPKKYDKISS